MSSEKHQDAPPDLTLNMSLEDALAHLTKQKASLRDPVITRAFPNMDIGAMERHYDDQIELLKQRAGEGKNYQHVLELHNAAQQAVNTLIQNDLEGKQSK